ncbi:hypothetical protein [Leucobacter sp. wl10]|uniref:hypothetical protein n=1 Tax=Leucobacter sp. wl10 TaxID=2304677 RepID=UPI000E5A1BF0|nr:hypothetical protein [Leucobacter sp. wl10]RGE21125.1 hypothetical protein D1J51_07895 [Leucobacter sp. wl10]
MSAPADGVFRRRDGARTYGYEVGVVCLDFDSPFIPGDVGHAATFGAPTLYRRVPRLSVPAILADAGREFEGAVVEAAGALAGEGTGIVTSNCGFMIRYQAAVARALPGSQVLLSSLLQLPLIAAMLGDTVPIGIVTADSRTLTEGFLREEFPGLPSPLLVAGLEEAPSFHYTMFGPGDALDRPAVAEEVVTASAGLHRVGAGAILFECAALPAYAAETQRRTGLPVYDFTTMVGLAMNAAHRRPF